MALSAQKTDLALLDEFNLRIDSCAQLIVCCGTGCRVALPRRAVEEHVMSHGFPQADCEYLLHCLQPYQEHLRDPSEAPLRLDGSPYDASLQDYHGFACVVCSMRTIHQEVMIQHVTTIHHDQTHALVDGQVEQGDDRDLYRHVYLQSWMADEPLERYWIVTHKETKEEEKNELDLSVLSTIRVYPGSSMRSAEHMESPQPENSRKRRRLNGALSMNREPARIFGPYGLFSDSRRYEKSAAMEDECEKATAYLSSIRMSVYEPHVGKRVELSDPAAYGVSDDSGPEYADWLMEYRLDQVKLIVKKWQFVGCALCYATTGNQTPDHDLTGCTVWACADLARDMLRWLEALSIPRRNMMDLRGDCPYCVDGSKEAECGEMKMYIKIVMSGPARRAQLREEYDAIPGPDGLCEKRAVIRHMIAALCAYDGQVLGRALAREVAALYGKDLTNATEARKWFIRPMVEDLVEPLPRLMHVVEMLHRAFRWRHASRFEDLKVQCPEAMWKMVDALSGKHSARDVRELRNWHSTLGILSNHCAFCLGRGLKMSDSQHTLQTCPWGAPKAIRECDMTQAIFRDKILPGNGCSECRLPREFCSRWERDETGQWQRNFQNRCLYEANLLRNSFMGFVSCGVTSYKDDMQLADEEQRDAEFNRLKERGIAQQRFLTLPRYIGWEEMAARFYAEPLVVAGVEGSGMLRHVADWTLRSVAYRKDEALRGWKRSCSTPYVDLTAE